MRSASACCVAVLLVGCLEVFHRPCLAWVSGNTASTPTTRRSTVKLQETVVWSIDSETENNKDSTTTSSSSNSIQDTHTNDKTDSLFDEFAAFLEAKQKEIIATIEQEDGSGQQFSQDAWGRFVDPSKAAGGITRVIQGGNVIEKGACSLTIIKDGVLSAERAAAIRSRQSADVQSGDSYKAAALSIVFHSRSPMVPTFRSDVRVFSVEPAAGRKRLSLLRRLNPFRWGKNKSRSESAWFGGGADLTPYYLIEDDVRSFHAYYKDLCDQFSGTSTNDSVPASAFSYETMKKCCDDYFFLPARSEHRGTGGIFFDDMDATQDSMQFVKGVADAWMPSWLPIVQERRNMAYTDKQRQWQLLRRGRYLEFNLLYDRGVKFGLANANPRVEGVMVSAPPLIAWEYNHKLEEGSEEAKLMQVLKEPVEWV